MADFVADAYRNAQETTRPPSPSSKSQLNSNTAATSILARDPTEAIRAMEAELEERRRIEVMLKVLM